jgi:glycosyltransferase involved in cell wall biosynthesis
MKIVIYIESLRTFTSGTPHRGVLLKLIELRSNDEFVLVLRKGDLPEYMQELFNKLKKFSNWSLRYEKRSRKLVNILALFHFKNHCEIKAEEDVCLSFDAEYLGFKNHPQIVTVYDLSSVRNSKSSSISPFKRIARKFTIENGVKHADHIVAISEFTKNDLLDYFDIEEEKITVIHNGIDEKWFHKGISNVTLHNDNYWIWWGAYSQRKNLERLFQAYELLLKETDGIPDLYLVGNKNEYFAKLLLIIEGSKVLKRKVKIYPKQDIDNLKVLVSNSVGLVFPSLYEGFGLPVIEAYSQQVPVLTSNVSSLPEISGDLGVLVDPNDIIDIKNGLLELNKMQQYQNEKLKEWAEQYTYEKAAIKYSELIDRCLKK